MNGMSSNFKELIADASAWRRERKIWGAGNDAYKSSEVRPIKGRKGERRLCREKDGDRYFHADTGSGVAGAVTFVSPFLCCQWSEWQAGDQLSWFLGRWAFQY